MNERIDYVLRRSTYQGENGLQVVKHRAGCFFSTPSHWLCQLAMTRCWFELRVDAMAGGELSVT